MLHGQEWLFKNEKALYPELYSEDSLSKVSGPMGKPSGLHLLHNCFKGNKAVQIRVFIFAFLISEVHINENTCPTY